MQNFRRDLHEIIFEAETPLGKTFDIFLLISIVLSVFAVCLESVSEIRLQYGTALRYAEWAFTILFTIEYGARIYCVEHPKRYILSFYGLVDLIAILPTYLSLFLAGAQSLLVIRALRLLRVFRVLKLGHYVAEANFLGEALKSSRQKISVFLVGVLTTVLITATLMYLIEGEEHGFTSIPKSIYWAIVTMTTVGYGDIAPETILGQTVASVLMIVGYGIIAIPTGIVSAEMVRADRDKKASTLCCISCSREGHDIDAKFCKYCGEKFVGTNGV